MEDELDFEILLIKKFREALLRLRHDGIEFSCTDMNYGSHGDKWR